jgi:hypothetical protein
VSGDLVEAAALELGAIYLDDEGTRWAVVGHDERGAALLTAPPSDAPDWHGVVLEPDGAWYESDRFIGYVEGLTPTGRRAVCRACGAALVATPGASAANHRPGCAWLTLAVRAVARGIASPTGRWLRPPRDEDLVDPGG